MNLVFDAQEEEDVRKNAHISQCLLFAGPQQAFPIYSHYTPMHVSYQTQPHHQMHQPQSQSLQPKPQYFLQFSDEENNIVYIKYLLTYRFLSYFAQCTAQGL